MTDFGRILADLNAVGLRYVVIGGIALVRHGVVRATRDVDVMADPTDATMVALRRLVDEWSATRPDGTPVGDRDLVAGRAAHLSSTHGQLDVLPPPRSVTFEDLAARAEQRLVDGTVAPICSLADLVSLKRIAGRPRDIADLADLEVAHGELPGD